MSAAEASLAPLVAGPTIATERQVLVVPAASRVRAPRDLAGRMICFIVGTRAEDALDRWATTSRVPIERIGFQEEIEMTDAYDVGKCAALAVDAQEVPHDGAHHVLAESLAETPVVAATPVSAGEGWRRTVAAVAAALPE